MTPLVLVDIDGVTNAFRSAFRNPHHHPARAAGYALVLDQRHPQWFAELEKHATLMWATMWQRAAVTDFAPVAGFGHDWPHIPFDEINAQADYAGMRMRIGDGVVGWKWRGILEYAGDGPLVYIDDDMHPHHHTWARDRHAAGQPTLFVQPDPEHGLTAHQYELVLRFVREHATVEVPR